MALKGHIVSEETRQKIAKKLKGRKLSEERKRKLRGRKLSEETKKKISESMKGFNPWANKNECQIKETKRKISKAMKGRHNSIRTEFKKGYRSLPIGYKHRKETREKISKAMKGRKAWNKGLKAEEYPNLKKSIDAMHRARAIKGYLAWNKGISCNKGANNPAWRGGISFEPYGIEFNKELKIKIKRRDNYVCQLCGCPERETIGGLYIHHINYNKKDNREENLITLCNSCHSRTNWDREFWRIMLSELVNEKYKKGAIK